MAYEFFYEGTPYSLEPNYGEGFIGYRVPHAQIGAPTGTQTANQIQEVTNLLNQGIKHIELQPISPEIFDQIPRQHFKEIERVQKLAGAETSVHAPIVEPSGITKEGWSETDRESAERHLMTVIDKSHELSPEGNIPVTIHASAIQGAEFSPPSEELISQYKKQIREKERREPTTEDMQNLNEKRLIAINQETKQMIPIERAIKYYPETGREIMSPRRELDIINDTEWINSITNLAFYKKEADETLKRAHAVLAPLVAMREKGEKIRQEDLDQKQIQALQEVGRTELFLNNVESSFRTMYNKAYQYSDENTKAFLKNQIAGDWKEGRKKLAEQIKGADYLSEIDIVAAKSQLIDNTLSQLKHIGGSVRLQSGEEIRLSTPEVYKPIEDFALENSAKTFANVALHAYEEYKDKAPIISVENLFPGMAFSRSEEMKKLIDESREKFVIEAVKKGHSKHEAEQAASRMIGVTWDVGHLNMMRKEGFKKEDIIKETEKIAPYVKHVHLTDNFGYSDSHLPPGMGNVPTKEILEKLEKAGFEGKKVIEAGGFVQHFKVPPTQAVLEALGSPLYSMKSAPYWNQIRATYGGYFSGYGPIYPEQHFSMYGTGFSGMPVELGGQMPGRQSRFSGAPTE